MAYAALNSDHRLIRATLMLAGVVEARDAYTGGHLWRVAQYGKLLGRKLGLGGRDLFEVTLAGYVHDIGKVGIPDHVLGKRGPLTDEEFETIKSHPVIGSELVRTHPLSELLDDVVRHHHERLDGKGYPDGIGGSEIRLPAAIVGVADVFDALTSSRPYRAGMPLDQALAILEQNKGTHHESSLVDAFVACARDREIDPILRHSSANQSLIDCLQCGPIIVVPAGADAGDTMHCPSCLNEYRLKRVPTGKIGAEPTGRTTPRGLHRPVPDEKGLQEIMVEAESI